MMILDEHIPYKIEYSFINARAVKEHGSCIAYGKDGAANRVRLLASHLGYSLLTWNITELPVYIRLLV